MEEAQASQLIPVNRSISLTFLLHQTLFPPSHHSPDQTSMIKFLPRLAQEGAGVAIAIANHPWFGRQGKASQAGQVKSRQVAGGLLYTSTPWQSDRTTCLEPWSHPSAKSVCKQRIVKTTTMYWCSPAYSNRNNPIFFVLTNKVF